MGAIFSCCKKKQRNTPLVEQLSKGSNGMNTSQNLERNLLSDDTSFFDDKRRSTVIEMADSEREKEVYRKKASTFICSVLNTNENKRVSNNDNVLHSSLPVSNYTDLTFGMRQSVESGLTGKLINNFSNSSNERNSKENVGNYPSNLDTNTVIQVRHENGFPVFDSFKEDKRISLESIKRNSNAENGGNFNSTEQNEVEGSKDVAEDKEEANQTEKRSSISSNQYCNPVAESNKEIIFHDNNQVQVEQVVDEVPLTSQGETVYEEPNSKPEVNDQINIEEPQIVDDTDFVFHKKSRSICKKNYYSEETNINQKIKLSVKLTNLEEITDKFSIELLHRKKETELDYLTINKVSEVELNQMVLISNEISFNLEQTNNLKFILSSDSTGEVTIMTTVGKIIGSKNLSVLIPIYKEESMVNFDYNYVQRETESPLFNLLITAEATDTEDKVYYSSFGVAFKLNLPAVPEREFKFILKQGINEGNTKVIYTSEQQKSNKLFSFLNISMDRQQFNLNGSPYSIELYEEEKMIAACGDIVSFSDEYQINSLPNNKPLGRLKFSYEDKVQTSFLEYLSKGLQVSFICGIDYTSSNLDYKEPNSLHASGDNLYELAIEKCGGAISNFDHDRIFPVYGFGGIPPHVYDVSHCFSVSLDTNYPKSIDEVIRAYRQSLEVVKLSGPTFFAPIIRKVIDSHIKEQEGNKNYYVLLLITDGLIDDMNETIDIIVEASRLPLSIIIVGIGDANFDKMEKLDGDFIPLINSKGYHRIRDIVQFVHLTQSNKGNFYEKVLKDVPEQIESYYRIRNFE